MRTNRRQIKVMVLSIFAMLFPLLTSAKVEINGIYYNLNKNTKQAEVTSGGDYSGSITIPATVTTFEGVQYSVTSIGTGAFNSCSSLTDITIPESVTSIGSFAFSGCSSLTSVTLPESVTNIGTSAFWDCESLTAITIPESVTSIGEKAFWDCESLTAITIPESVTSIGSYAFSGCSSLTSITIPNSVTIINEYTFKSCSNLRSVIIGNGMLTISNYAFQGTSPDKVIWKTNTPPEGYKYVSGKINYVANNQYAGLSNIQIYPYISSIFEVDGTTYVPNPADKTCDAIDCSYSPISEHVIIDSIVVYKGKQMIVRSVMPYTFYKNNYVKYASISNNESIENNAFYDCNSLTEVTIGNKINTIKENAFYNCKNLKSFEVGRNLKSIGDGAFYGCNNIEKFTCYSKQPPVCGSMALSHIDKWNCTLNVPQKAVERYQAADQWEGFFFTEGFEVEKFKARFYVDGVLYETVETEYHEEIVLPTNPQKEGHTFSGWKDLPSIMPTANIDIHGTFTINKYNLTYMLDGKKHYSTSVVYGEPIPAIETPTKVGHTFSGWSRTPETMPAKDLTISGTFIINKYLITFKIGNNVIASDSLEYGAVIVTPEAPVKEGHTFNGWGEVAEIVPANDLTYEGSYTVNSYTLFYVVDGDIYEKVSANYGEAITPMAEPTKEGYAFSGWSEMPETMPAKDITVTGTFTRLSPVYLTIQQADNGRIKHIMYEGTVVRYQIEAVEGWTINTVTFNGEDITEKLAEGNIFTTPEMYEDAVLNISYEKIDDSIENTRANAVKVRGHNGIISISGAAEGEAITIYTLDGVMVANATATTEITTIEVPTQQVYIVKVADKVVKIGM